MQTIRIFLASSAELDADKEQVELFIGRKNKDYRNKRVFLELSTWKDFISAMTEVHSQEKYNQYIRTCDIAVFLFHTRLGRFTREEFDTAHTAFLHSSGTKKRPRVYTFFKQDPCETSEIAEFKTYVDSLNHFYDTYISLEDLFVKLNRQLDKLENEKYIMPGTPDLPIIIRYLVYYFLLPLLTIGGTLAAYYYYQPARLTVKIREVRGIPNLPFKEGVVSLTYGDETKTDTIKDKVMFTQIPSKYKHNELNLKFSARGFVPVDTMIAVNELIELPVKRDNALGVVFGIVQDEDRNPLQGVLVAYKELKSLTGQDGRFRIDIPVEFQSDSINIIATKPGYQLFEWTGAPSQFTGWEIQLQNKKEKP